MRSYLCALVFCCFGLPVGYAQRNDDDLFRQWPIDLRINGKIIVGGDDESVAALAGLLDESDLTGEVAVLVDPEITSEQWIQLTSIFSDAKRYQAVRRDRRSQYSEIDELIANCRTFVWQSSRPLDHSNEAEQIHLLGEKFNEFLLRGGTLVILGPAGETAGAIVFDSQNDGAATMGLKLLPDCLIEFGEGKETRERVVTQLADRGPMVGIALDAGTLLQLSGRTMSTAGNGSATFMLAPTENVSRPRVQTIQSRTSDPPPQTANLIDLTQWRREAIDRTLDPFPPADPDPPFVKNGTLVIVGGGGMPEGLMAEFIKLAGGVEQAKLVYVPCSERKFLPKDQSTVRQWQRMGVETATFMHTKDRNRANTDEEFLEPLVDATGIWFGGGRQWNFADSYHGTQAHRLMKEVLDRGGVVGGSSAGASIQANFLARATPIGNERILAPGYERGGLGFITGVAIDQHFTQRGRQKDMSLLVKRYPQLLGIGIDESTALVVQKSIGKVVGKGEVYFYDSRLPVAKDGADYIKLAAGSSYDLATRTILEKIEPATEEKETVAANESSQ